MSYRLDLDEYDEETLRRELLQREEDQLACLCDYCHRPARSEPWCKFTERHGGKSDEYRQLLLLRKVT